MGDVRVIRMMLNCLYGSDQGGFIKSFKTEFKANKDGRVTLLEIAGRWLDDLEEKKQQEFINGLSSGVILRAEADAKEWLADHQRKLGRYSFDNLSDVSLSLLARAVLDELILSRYDQLTERDKELAREAEETNMLFRNRKRIMLMAEKILSSKGHNLTGPDVEVLQAEISLEIESARKRLEGASSEQAEEPAAERLDVMPVTWRSDAKMLTELADQLQEQGYIKSSQWFVERFGSDCPPDVDGWEGPANLIVYLLEKLRGRKLIVHVPQSRLERIFGIKHYKQKKTGYENNNTQKPKNADEIDQILSSVFPNS